jgi:hypothetical protein
MPIMQPQKVVSTTPTIDEQIAYRHPHSHDVWIIIVTQERDRQDRPESPSKLHRTWMDENCRSNFVFPCTCSNVGCSL